MANEFKIKKGLIVTGASGGTVVDIQGSQGQLFSVTDDLSGSILAVSDISGVPILDVNSSGLSTFDGSANFTGTIGIGTAPTTNAIEIDGVDGTSYVYFKSAAATTGARVGLNGDDLIIENKQASGDIIFDTAATERLRIASGGNATFAGEVTATEYNLPSGGMLDWANGDARIVEGLVSNFSLSLQTYDGTNVTTALRLDGDNTATFTGLVNGITPTANANFTTKQYVDSLITGATIYRGTWDPDVTANSGNGTPDLSSVTQVSGYYYICNADGTAHPNGTTGSPAVPCEPDSWNVGDWVIWNDDVVDCAGTGTGAWQKIDNSSVISGAGDGQTVALWEGTAGVAGQETLGNAPITVSGSNSTFAGDVTLTNGQLTVTHDTNNVAKIIQSATSMSNATYTFEVDSSSHTSNMSAAGAMAVDVNSGRALTIDGKGDIGIGTNAPATLLHVKGDADDNESVLFIENTYSSGGVFFPAALFKHTASNHSYGTVAEFRTEGTSSDRPSILFSNGHNTNNWSIGQGVSGANDNFAIGYRNFHPNTSGGWATSYLTINTSGNATFAGNVGVAGKTPTYGLTLAQGTAVGSKIAWTDSSPNFAASIYANSSTDKLTFATKNSSNVETTALEIDISQNATFAGDVTTGPSITATGNTGNSTLTLQANTGNWTFTNVQASRNLEISDSDGTGTVMTINTSGNVGIGTTGPNTKLQVSGTGLQGMQAWFGNGFVNNANYHYSFAKVGFSSEDNDGADTGAGFQFNTRNAADTNWMHGYIYQPQNGGIAFGTGGAGTTQATEKMRISSAGAIKFNAYDSTNNTGTPTYVLGTDASGNVVKVLGGDIPGGGGTVTGSGTLRTIPMWTPDGTTLGDSVLKQDVANQNIGLGVTPETGMVTYVAQLRIGEQSALQGHTDGVGQDSATWVTTNYKFTTTGAQFINGTVAAPGYANVYQQQSGDHSFSCSTVAGVAGGSVVGRSQMVIKQSGNVGIGTTSPGTLHSASYGFTRLHVDGGTDRGQMIIEGDSFAGIVLSDNGATANQRVFATSVDDTKYTIKPLNDNGTSTAGGVAVTVLHGGNVGIGVTDPQAKLEVMGASASPADGNEVISVTNTTGGSKLLLGVAENSYGWIQSAEGSTYRNLLLNPLGGNVGIGVTGPIEKLQVVGQLISTGSSSTSATVGVERAIMDLSNYSATDHSARFGHFRGAESAGAGQLRLYTDSVERLRIDAGGNVGIGTTVPQTKLAIGSAQGSGIDFLYDATNNYKHQIKNYWNSNTDSRMDFNIGRTSGVTPVTIMSVGYGGNVGIGTTTPNAKLDIQGTQGQLFSVTDDLSGSIFAVSDISGVPIFDVNSSGKVGINTTSANDIFDVRSSSWATRIQSTTDGTYLRMSPNQIATFNSANAGSSLYLNNSSSGNIIMAGGGGNVGIGITNPAVPLDVEGKIRSNDNNSADYLEIFCDGSVSGDSYIENTSNNIQIKSAYATSFSTSGSVAMFIDNNQNVGIQNTSPSSFDTWQRQLVVGSGSADAGITIYHGSGSGNQGAISFADGNTGTDRYRGSISYNGADEMKFFTSTTERVRIDNSGSMILQDGINYTVNAPTHRGVLILAGPSAPTNFGGIEFHTNPGGGAGYGSKIYASDATWGVATRNNATAFSDRFAISGSTGNAYFTGNLGIGDTGPVVKLVVADKSLTRHSNSSWGQSAIANPNDAECAFVWGAGGTGYPGITSTYTRQWIAGLSPFSTGTDRWSLTNKTLGANTAITVLEDGKIGMGTITPDEKLTVNGITRSVDQLFFGAINTDNGTYGPYIESSDDKGLKFDYNGNTGGEFQVWNHDQNGGGALQVFNIDQDGNVGINITSGSDKLTLKGAFSLYDTNAISAVIRLNPNGDSYINGGDLGVGITLPQHKLDVGGTIRSYNYRLAGNTTNPTTTAATIYDQSGVGLTLSAHNVELRNYNGSSMVRSVFFTHNTATFTGTCTATNFILSSDETLKENIKDIADKHINVSWKNFELKSEPGVKRSGVIAQELETKHPEFVRTNKDGLKSVAYIDLLIAKIAELEARLEKAGL